MPLLQLVANEGESCNGPLRFRFLPAGQSPHIPESETHMPETPTSATGNYKRPSRLVESYGLVFTVAKEVPEDLIPIIENRIYMLLYSRGIEANVKITKQGQPE